LQTSRSHQKDAELPSMFQGPIEPLSTATSYAPPATVALDYELRRNQESTKPNLDFPVFLRS
jgi:hypothetical protein